MRKINLQILLIAVLLAIAAPIRAMSRALLLPRAGRTHVVSPSWSRRWLTWISGAQKRVPVNNIPKVTTASLFALGGPKRLYSNSLTNVPTTSDNLITSSLKQPIAPPADWRPSWLLSSAAVYNTYKEYLEAKNDLKKQYAIGFLVQRLAQSILSSGYNPINLTESGTTFLGDTLSALRNRLLQQNENYEKKRVRRDKWSSSDKISGFRVRDNDNALLAYLRSVFFASLNVAELVAWKATIQQDVSAFIAKSYKKVSELYNFACLLELYETVGFDLGVFNIDSEKMHRFINFLRNDPYKNAFDDCLIDNPIQSKREALAIDVYDIIKNFEKYYFEYDFAVESIDLSKQLVIGVRGFTIDKGVFKPKLKDLKSSRTVADMIAHGELRRFIYNDIFNDALARTMRGEFQLWLSSRQEPRVMTERMKDEDKFFWRDNNERYKRLEPLLKESNEHEMQKLKKDYLELFACLDFLNPVGKSAYLSNDIFGKMYNELMHNGIYQGNEQLYRTFMQEYAPDKLKHKKDSGEISSYEFDYIESMIAKLNNARTQQKATE